MKEVPPKVSIFEPDSGRWATAEFQRLNSTQYRLDGQVVSARLVAVLIKFQRSDEYYQQLAEGDTTSVAALRNSGIDKKGSFDNMSPLNTQCLNEIYLN